MPYLVLAKSKRTQRSRSTTWDPSTISNLQTNTLTSSPYSRSLLHGGSNRKGKSKISAQTLLLRYPGRGAWSVLGQPLIKLSSNRVSSAGIWKWGLEKKWLNLLNHKVRSYELFTANRPPYVFPLGKNRGSLSQRGKQNQRSRQAQSDKQDMWKETGIPGAFAYNSFLSLGKIPALKFIEISLIPAIKYHFHLL